MKYTNLKGSLACHTGGTLKGFMQNATTEHFPIRKSLIQRTLEEHFSHCNCLVVWEKQLNVIVAEYLQAAKKDKTLSRIEFFCI